MSSGGSVMFGGCVISRGKSEYNRIEHCVGAILDTWKYATILSSVVRIAIADIVTKQVNTVALVTWLYCFTVVKSCTNQYSTLCIHYVVRSLRNTSIDTASVITIFPFAELSSRRHLYSPLSAGISELLSNVLRKL